MTKVWVESEGVKSDRNCDGCEADIVGWLFACDQCVDTGNGGFDYCHACMRSAIDNPTEHDSFHTFRESGGMIIREPFVPSRPDVITEQKVKVLRPDHSDEWANLTAVAWTPTGRSLMLGAEYGECCVRPTFARTDDPAARRDDVPCVADAGEDVDDEDEVRYLSVSPSGEHLVKVQENIYEGSSRVLLHCLKIKGAPVLQEWRSKGDADDAPDAVKAGVHLFGGVLGNVAVHWGATLDASCVAVLYFDSGFGVSVFSAATGELLARTSDGTRVTSPSLCWAPDGRVLSFGAIFNNSSYGVTRYGVAHVTMPAVAPNGGGGALVGKLEEAGCYRIAEGFTSDDGTFSPPMARRALHKTAAAIAADEPASAENTHPQLFAVGLKDGTVLVFEERVGADGIDYTKRSLRHQIRVPQQLRGESDPEICSISFSEHAAGLMAVGFCADDAGGVCVYDVNNNCTLATVLKYDTEAFHLAFSPFGAFLAVTVDERATVYNLAQCASGSGYARLPWRDDGSGGAPVVASHRFLSCTLGGGARGKDKAKHFAGAYSPDGQYMFSGGNDCELTRHDLRINDGIFGARSRAPHSRVTATWGFDNAKTRDGRALPSVHVTKCAVSQCGAFVAYGGSVEEKDQGDRLQWAVIVRDVKTGAVVAAYAEPGRLDTLQLLDRPDGCWLMLSMYDDRGVLVTRQVHKSGGDGGGGEPLPSSMLDGVYPAALLVDNTGTVFLFDYISKTFQVRDAPALQAAGADRDADGVATLPLDAGKVYAAKLDDTEYEMFAVKDDSTIYCLDDEGSIDVREKTEQSAWPVTWTINTGLSGDDILTGVCCVKGEQRYFVGWSDFRVHIFAECDDAAVLVHSIDVFGDNEFMKIQVRQCHLSPCGRFLLVICDHARVKAHVFDLRALLELPNARLLADQKVKSFRWRVEQLGQTYLANLLSFGDNSLLYLLGRAQEAEFKYLAADVSLDTLQLSESYCLGAATSILAVCLKADEREHVAFVIEGMVRGDGISYADRSIDLTVLCRKYPDLMVKLLDGVWVASVDDLKVVASNELLHRPLASNSALVSECVPYCTAWEDPKAGDGGGQSVHEAEVKIPGKVETTRFAHMLDCVRLGWDDPDTDADDDDHARKPFPNLFHALTAAKSKDIISTRFMRRAIQLKRSYVSVKFWREFVLYVLLVVVVTTHAFMTRAFLLTDWEADGSLADSLFVALPQPSLGNMLVGTGALQAFLCVVMLARSVFKCRRRGYSLREWYSRGWNVLDLAVYGTNIAAVFVVFANVDAGRRVQAAGTLLAWIGIFSYMRTPP
jgi:WD40 repeat protein